MSAEKVAALKLVTNDNEIFDVPLNVIRLSRMIYTMLQDLNLDNELNDPIPISNVSGPIMKKVLKWCTYHRGDSPGMDGLRSRKKLTDDISSCHAEFLKVDQRTFFQNNPCSQLP
ncbi:hypothetical protein KIN20_028998 [Parelaphostrongylus tenuis]|uniref:SKP1 component POZ domain-containing protein n=1 Tax=Parelaphostrongylus tenuis TaxID=148309 RepID=A0AAD5R1L8_PARTN|nr:hypothetical protein KIN20_028998 [Parelaphostrongylus tenuis]